MYALDTNTCIALLNGNPESVSRHFEQARRKNIGISVPSIVTYELWYGTARSTRQKYNTDRLHAFFSGAMTELSFDAEDAKSAGEIRAALERNGTTIGPYDTLIAGQALRRGLTLVTANTREFKRVKDLRLENWAD
jgi:tRNA(fMet)-specific endonuclease VapC